VGQGTTLAQEPAQAAAASRAIHLAVIMVTLPGATSFAVSPEEVNQTYFGATDSVAAFMSAASYGTVTVTGATFGPFAVNGDTHYCSVGDWATSANAAAALGGVDLQSFDYFAYLFPRVGSCPWAGMAAVGDSASYINAPAKGKVGLYHAVHELMHDLGAGHANGLRCNSGGTALALSAPASCTAPAYQDPYSVMGIGAVRLPSAWERLAVGFLGDEDVARVASTAYGRYTIGDANSTSEATRLLLIERNGGGLLAIDYRRPTVAFDDYDARDPGVNGAIVRVVNPGDMDTQLVDAAPETSSWRDAPLGAGQTFIDTQDDVQISVVESGPTSVTIDVQPVGVQPPIDTTTPPPTPPTTPPPTPPAAGSPAPPTVVTAQPLGNRSVLVSWETLDQSTVDHFLVRLGRRATRTTDSLDYIFSHVRRGWHSVVIRIVDDAGLISSPLELRFRT
jgi:hypothetical protein